MRGCMCQGLDILKAKAQISMGADQGIRLFRYFIMVWLLVGRECVAPGLTCISYHRAKNGYLKIVAPGIDFVSSSVTVGGWMLVDVEMCLVFVVQRWWAGQGHIAFDLERNLISVLPNVRLMEHPLEVSLNIEFEMMATLIDSIRPRVLVMHAMASPPQTSPPHTSLELAALQSFPNPKIIADTGDGNGKGNNDMPPGLQYICSNGGHTTDLAMANRFW